MSKTIRFRELPSTHEESTEAGVSAYLLEAQDVLLGFLYLDLASYTIAWRGNPKIDIREMYGDTLHFLTNQIREDRGLFFHSYNPAYKARVSFIISDETKELAEYELDDPAQAEKYRKILYAPGRISFARYDFHVQAARFVFDCALTVENPYNISNRTNQDRELAVQLPRSLPPSADSLKWIIDRHSEAAYLRHVDIESSVIRLSELISSRSSSASSEGLVSFG